MDSDSSNDSPVKTSADASERAALEPGVSKVKDENDTDMADAKVVDADRTSAAEHIRELNAIDQDVTKSLRAAGDAIKALTSPPIATEDDEDADEMSSLDSAKKAFETQTNSYYSLVQSVSARLRRQVYALEEAGIIAPDKASMEQQSAPPPPSRPATSARNTAARTGTTAAAMQQQRPEPPMEITNGGLGNLDVGWLNSRSDKVGKQMEAELWAQARAQVDALLKEHAIGASGSDHQTGAGPKDGMEVDDAGT